MKQLSETDALIVYFLSRVAFGRLFWFAFRKRAEVVGKFVCSTDFGHKVNLWHYEFLTNCLVHPIIVPTENVYFTLLQ